MARGGYHGRGGPPPDPTALRRDRPADRAGWVDLPAAGRKGRAPAWPLTRPSPRERALWAAEWKRPQAVEWERNGQQLEVALYVRTLVTAEAAGASTAMRLLVVRQQESLGLSLPGLQRNRWRIVDTPPAAARARPKLAPVVPIARTPGSARDRLHREPHR